VSLREQVAIAVSPPGHVNHVSPPPRPVANCAPNDRIPPIVDTRVDGVPVAQRGERQGNMNATGMHSDAGRAKLRTIIASMDVEMAKLSASGTTGHGAGTGLLGAWADLVETLDLGPAPQLRDCPVCGHSGMAAATACGYCWSKLVPLAV
jgi:hypothetical protein